MSIQEDPQSDLEREHIVRETLGALRSTIQVVNLSIQEIVFTGRVPTMGTFHPVQQFRESAQTLAASSRDIAAEENSSRNAMHILEGRMYQKLRQHEFYILKVSIQNRERIITSLGESAPKSAKTTVSPLWRLIDSIFLRIGYDLAEIRHRKDLQNQIRRIIAEIEFLMGNPYFEKTSMDNRETYELKWKQYVTKAGKLGIELPENSSL